MNYFRSLLNRWLIRRAIASAILVSKFLREWGEITTESAAAFERMAPVIRDQNEGRR